MSATFIDAPTPTMAMPTRTVLPELRPWVWPFLLDYQREGVCRAVGRGNHMFAWPCGAGKTAAAIVWALADTAPVIVFCRASARRQWASQVRRFSFIRPFVLLPKGDRKPEAQTLAEYITECRLWNRRPFVILGWPSLVETWMEKVRLPGGGERYIDKEKRGLVREIEQFLVATGTPPSIIWDESHIAKDYRRKKRVPRDDGGFDYPRRTTMAAVAGFLAPRARRRLALTATPMPDRTRDLWAQLDIMEPKQWGKYWGEGGFAETYCGAYEHLYGWYDKGATDLGTLRKAVAPIIHVVTSEQLKDKLPAMRRTITFLSHDTLTRADRDSINAVRTASRQRDRESVLQAKLEMASARKDRHVVQTVVDSIKSGQKVLVFCGRRKDVERLRGKITARLQKEIRTEADPKKDDAKVYTAWKLWAADGGTNPIEREKIREAYMAYDGPACIVGTGAAWGESSDLQDTDRLIIVMLPWTWGQIRQWEGRIRRLGGRACLVEYLVAEGTVDERVAGIVLEKLAAVEQLLPDEQVGGVRETLQGGTDEAVIDGLLDRILEAA